MFDLFNHKISGISISNVIAKILCIIKSLAKNIYCFYPRAERNSATIEYFTLEIGATRRFRVSGSLPRFIGRVHLLLCITILNTNVMCLIKYVNRLERIDALIFMKATGTPEQFAGKLGISRSTLFQTLQEIRYLGVDVRYCCHRQSYYYADDRRIRVIIEAISEY